MQRKASPGRFSKPGRDQIRGPVRLTALPFSFPAGWSQPPPGMAPYARRGKVLALMGYESYAEYLDSPLWAQIRRRVLRRDRYRCQLGTCLAKTGTVHHVDYTPENLSGNRLWLMHAICEPCHERIEHDDAGAKIGPRDVGVRAGYLPLRKPSR